MFEPKSLRLQKQQIVQFIFLLDRLDERKVLQLVNADNRLKFV